MRPKIICLTPIRNEAWILDRFLKSASMWADHIIIADQMSTDGSREIAKRYLKVTLIDNPSEEFNEPERQRLLIKKAREIEGQRLLITLDADEIFSPDIFSSNDWHKIVSSEAGTIIEFQLANLAPDLKRMWYGAYEPLGYMDDNYEHTGNNKIHSGRIPYSEDHIKLKIKSIKIIHLQYTNWRRMESKHRWYQCYERIIYPQKSALDILRLYGHMYGIKSKELIPIPSNWNIKYNLLDLEILRNISKENNWFDDEVLELFDKYGNEKFRKLRIWDNNWIKSARERNKTELVNYKDPRSFMDKLIQMWVITTQSSYKDYSFSGRLVRKTDKLIKKYCNY